MAPTRSCSPPALARTAPNCAPRFAPTSIKLGIVLDAEKNNSTRATEAVISAANSRVKVMVIPTNEELVVARETKRFLERN